MQLHVDSDVYCIWNLEEKNTFIVTISVTKGYLNMRGGWGRWRLKLGANNYGKRTFYVGEVRATLSLKNIDQDWAYNTARVAYIANLVPLKEWNTLFVCVFVFLFCFSFFRVARCKKKKLARLCLMDQCTILNSSLLSCPTVIIECA